jgi:hypothetical protein
MGMCFCLHMRVFLSPRAQTRSADVRIQGPLMPFRQEAAEYGISLHEEYEASYLVECLKMLRLITLSNFHVAGR